MEHSISIKSQLDDQNQEKIDFLHFFSSMEFISMAKIQEHFTLDSMDPNNFVRKNHSPLPVGEL